MVAVVDRLEQAPQPAAEQVCPDCLGTCEMVVTDDSLDVPVGSVVPCGCARGPVTWDEVEAGMAAGHQMDIPPMGWAASPRFVVRPVGFCAGWEGKRPHVVPADISHAPAVTASVWTVFCGHCGTVLVSFGKLDTPAYRRDWYELVDTAELRHGGVQVGSHVAPMPSAPTIGVVRAA